MLAEAKLIAEPWDVGEGGYQVGKFPPLWAEWNGRYRDVVRTGRAADPTGIVYLFPADVSPRTGVYVYSYIRTLSDLSLAEGLR